MLKLEAHVHTASALVMNLKVSPKSSSLAETKMLHTSAIVRPALPMRILAAFQTRHHHVRLSDFYRSYLIKFCFCQHVTLLEYMFEKIINGTLHNNILE